MTSEEPVWISTVDFTDAEAGACQEWFDWIHENAPVDILQAGPILAQIIPLYLPELNIPESAALIQRFIDVAHEAAAFRKAKTEGMV